MGNRFTATFDTPVAACADPLNPNNGYYLGDQSSIRYFDLAKDEVTLFAGSVYMGQEDGRAENARFYQISSLLISPDGHTMWCGDDWGLKHIVIVSREVTAWDEYTSSLRSLCWDRTPSTSTSASAFYGLTSAHSGRQISRFDTASREWTYPVKDGSSVSAFVSTATGHLIYTKWINTSNQTSSPTTPFTSATFAFDPITCSTQRLDFIATDPFTSLIVNDSTRTLIAMHGRLLTTYTLPSTYFPLPKCCDRDL